MFTRLSHTIYIPQDGHYFCTELNSSFEDRILSKLIRVNCYKREFRYVEFYLITTCLQSILIYIYQTIDEQICVNSLYCLRSFWPLPIDNSQQTYLTNSFEILHHSKFARIQRYKSSYVYMRFELNKQTNMLIQSYYINETPYSYKYTYTPRDLTQIHIAPYIDLLWGRSTHNNNNNKKCATDTDTKFVLVRHAHSPRSYHSIHILQSRRRECKPFGSPRTSLSILGLLGRAMR